MDPDIAARIWDQEVGQGIRGTLEYRDLVDRTPGGLSSLTAQQCLDGLADRQAEIRARYRDPAALSVPTFDPESTTAVFLDIDGVVSPDPRQDPFRFELAALSTFLLPSTPVSVDVLRWFRTYQPARLLWSSSWCSMALTLTEALGGGPVETVIDERSTLSKKESVTAYLIEHPEVTRVMVCEDQPYRLDAPELAHLEVAYLVTDPYVGLTAADLARLDGFIAGG